MEACYKIVFRGELAPGATIEQVKQKLAALYKAPVAKLDPWFSGKPVTIKGGLEQATALKYQKALEQAGAICAIEPDQKTAATIVPPQPRRTPAGTRAAPVKPGPPKMETAVASSQPRPAAERAMICPKCRQAQPQADTCRKCGVVIAKYLAAQQKSADEEDAPEEAAEQETALMTQRGRPVRAHANFPAATRAADADDERIKKYHLLGAPAIMVVLLALLLPFINISCNNQKLLTVSGYQLLSGNMPANMRGAELPSNFSVKGGGNWFKIVIALVMLTAVGVSGFAVLGSRNAPETPLGIGVALCGIGLLLTLGLGYYFGVRAEGELKTGLRQGMRELQNMGQVSGQEQAQGQEKQVQAFAAVMASSMNPGIEMDAGYYLILIAFLLGVGGFWSPFLVGETRSTALIVVLGLALGLTLFLCLKGLFSPAAADSMGQMFQQMPPGMR